MQWKITMNHINMKKFIIHFIIMLFISSYCYSQQLSDSLFDANRSKRIFMSFEEQQNILITPTRNGDTLHLSDIINLHVIHGRKISVLQERVTKVETAIHKMNIAVNRRIEEIIAEEVGATRSANDELKKDLALQSEINKGYIKTEMDKTITILSEIKIWGWSLCVIVVLSILLLIAVASRYLHHHLHKVLQVSINGVIEIQKQDLDFLNTHVQEIHELLNSIRSTHHVNIIKKEVGDKKPEIAQTLLIQYNDAIAEFERINCKIFNQRKNRQLSIMLLSFLAGCEFDKAEFMQTLNTPTLSEELKESFVTIIGDVERFNEYRRNSIEEYLSLKGFSISNAIRFPLHKPFDMALDHHLLGEEPRNGSMVIIVCKLGYHFPDSLVCPYRIKSEVLTEKY